MTYNKRVIATCTTIPSRCEHVVEMANSILYGAYPVDKLVLNLFSGDWTNGIPSFLKDFEKKEDRFEIFLTDENYWSATKLVPSIKRFADDILVAVDDDKTYQATLVSSLISKWLEHRNCVISMKSEKIRDVFGQIEISNMGRDSLEEDLYMIPATGGGVLFPPHVFDNTHVTDKDMFLEWQKPQDDRWWWMNFTMNNVKAISAVKFFSDNQFRNKDFTTADTIHEFLWVPENIRSLDKRCVEWLSRYSPLVRANIPKLKIVQIQDSGDCLILIDEYGLGRKFNYAMAKDR